MPTPVSDVNDFVRFIVEEHRNILPVE